MPRRVIVGFDGSPAADAALAWAVEEARLHNVDLVALAVLERPAGALDGPAGQSESAAIRSGVFHRLRTAVETATAQYPAGFEMVSGDAAAGLVAGCVASDLLVVGSSGLGPIHGQLLGSVSRACLHQAPCPVVVVRAPAPFVGHHRVLVGIDASAHSRRALRVAAEEATLRGDALHALHAVHWDHLGAELIVPSTEQLIAWGKQLVQAEVTRAAVAARPVVVAGHESEVLVRHSAHADLLVLGARGRSPLAALLFGSTSDYCARHAGCPVMIVRSG